MNRNEQRLEMLDKLSMILSNFPESYSIRDISNKTGIPQTTVYTYLHNDKLICDLFGFDANSDEYKEFRELIQKWLDKAKKEGPSKGNEILWERYGNIKR